MTEGRTARENEEPSLARDELRQLGGSFKTLGEAIERASSQAVPLERLCELLVDAIGTMIDQLDRAIGSLELEMLASPEDSRLNGLDSSPSDLDPNPPA